MTGILPSLEVHDLTLDSMTPRDRYRALNDAVMEATGSRIRLRLQGMDELLLEHDNVVLEALSSPAPVSEIMVRNPITVQPETPTLEALRLLREQNITALPVTRDGRLVGILSERDLLPVLTSFFESREKPSTDS